ncbi:gliding motility lipoprotein GldB [Ichthyenterobacterium sp. W332]|uniref:Gliding motility lipoprotein GldB n=1 Tax=Microcosmobacter mediterraneus TaxID=3075607 RepID=A0ABU2YN03_9FLAO|nr:gliding motility lipoprotein GldB [Ichthyenterobacterium sp. W332]MDT0559049.1 gliding motility lipoprotein GldB [Ichthyenterobacterium sp. W332]
MKNFYLLLVVLIAFFSCEKDAKINSEITKIDVDFSIERFETAFSNANPNDLTKLKTAFPFLFPKRVPDSVWVETMIDTLQQELRNEVTAAYKDFKTIQKDLELLFQHLKYYDQFFNEPRVITLTNNVRYREKVVVTDSIVLVALDNYLGKDHRFYSNIPQYISKNFSSEYIVVDLAEKYAKNYIYPSSKKTFLDEMIYYGKLLYFKDIIIPFKTDAQKIGYTPQELSWAQDNESHVWSYFVERELLFSTDSKLPSQFISVAPFSKFYLEIDNSSPGRIGQFIGWQIVRKYMKDNKVSLLDMMQKSTDEIFNNTKYKPKQ